MQKIEREKQGREKETEVGEQRERRKTAISLALYACDCKFAHNKKNDQTENNIGHFVTDF